MHTIDDPFCHELTPYMPKGRGRSSVHLLGTTPRLGFRVAQGHNATIATINSSITTDFSDTRLIINDFRHTKPAFCTVGTTFCRRKEGGRNAGHPVKLRNMFTRNVLYHGTMETAETPLIANRSEGLCVPRALVRARFCVPIEML